MSFDEVANMANVPNSRESFTIHGVHQCFAFFSL
jgi:hypothetical protein